jgi:3-isopropylmalate/(R)-2-methylmalate dehydratase small subunit
VDPLVTHEGTTAVLRRDRVDTDQIIPAEYCRGLSRSGYADGLFAHWRRDPAFMLNEPARAQATILLAGADFGTGSSREHAVWALRDWGLRAVLAPSFGDIFRRNMLKNRLLPVVLPVATIGALMDLGDAAADFALTIDPEAGQVRWAAAAHEFELDRRARRLLRGDDEISISIGHAAAIGRYEGSRARWLPAFAPDGRRG